MNKRTRFAIIIAVLAVCFWFLWPSISWYVRTPKDEQTLALGSLEKIKDYATVQASADVNALKRLANEHADAVLDPSYGYVVKAAERSYKLAEKKVPVPMTVSAVMGAFGSESELLAVIEADYRDKILKAKNRYTNSVKLGLDLSGGMNIIVRADLDAALAAQSDSNAAIADPAAFKREAMAQAIETLTSRIDKFGLTSPVIRQQGEDRIYIEIPGAADGESVNTLIMGKGILNFHLVDREATNAFNEYYRGHAASTFSADGNLLDPTIIPDDCMVMGVYQKDEYGLDERVGYLVLKKEPVLDGKYIKSAQVTANNITNQPQVTFSLSTERNGEPLSGAEIFGNFTSAHVNDSMAIVSDDKIKSYANINEPITTGQVAISGFGLEEAQNIQKVLQTAWLSVPLEVESQQVIGASLGDQAIRQGMRALCVGLVAVLVFMLLYYLGAGFNAVVAQVLNMYIVFAILSAFNLTLTLSSIAGMILTVGMSVDANVIIFERIKEELRAGKSRAAAIAAGFDNALWAILDSNITTFIAAIFLSQLGTGSIQGFAVSLAIGVVSSVFTALVVSRLMFDFQTDVIGKKNVSISWRVK